MPNDNDDQDEDSANSESMFVRMASRPFRRLVTFTRETVPHEDHGDFVIVHLVHLRWLRRIANLLATVFGFYDFYDDDTN